MVAFSELDFGEMVVACFQLV